MHEKRQAQVVKALCWGQNIAMTSEMEALYIREKPFVQTEDVLPVIIDGEVEERDN